ncbi:MAG: hypothetical protein AAF533_00555 [Acidobacteriota bacterium]
MVVSGSSSQAESRLRTAPPWHGACVLHLAEWEGRLDAAKLDRTYAHLRSQGATAVALSAFAWQDRLSSTTLRAFDGDAERGFHELEQAVTAAHRHGLAVLLKPHVEIGTEGKRDGTWRGEIRFDKSRQARAWFKSYRSFMLQLADLAQRQNVEVLAIGLELGGLSGDHREEWSRLVAAIRDRYSGRLTYCANWWGEFGTTEIWSELDLLGVQAFAPLSGDPAATDAALAQGAREIIRKLRAESERWKRPLLLTEYGFKSSPSPWVEPWQWDIGKADPEAQRRAHLAWLRALEGTEGRPTAWLFGSFCWLYEAGRPTPGPKDGGFSPGGKPAEGVLSEVWRRWNRASRNANQAEDR